MSQREFPPVHESVIDLEARLRYENHAKRRSRIHLLILIVSGQVKNRSEAAKHLRVHRNSVYNWLEAYKAGGLEQMLQIGTTGPRAEQKSLPAPCSKRCGRRSRAKDSPGTPARRSGCERSTGWNCHTAPSTRSSVTGSVPS